MKLDFQKAYLTLFMGQEKKLVHPVSNPLVKGVSFTGSTQTGKSIAEKKPLRRLKVSLEMGGKNPNIIFEDCDFEKAVNTTVRSSFENQGQICLCGSRILFKDQFYEKIKDALAKTENGHWRPSFRKQI